MFVKLTKKDNSPIWISATSIVTIEPNKDSGSIVVPMGDGLDYEVKESPEVVISLITGEAIPQETPKKRATRKAKATEEESKTADVVKAEIIGQKEKPAKKEVQPKKKSVKAQATKKTSSTKKSEEAKKIKAVVKTEEPKKVVGEKKITENKKAEKISKEEDVAFFPAEHLERLRKMAPGSVKKLTNTLLSQFKSINPNATIKLLCDTGAISIVENGRIKWLNSNSENILNV